MNKNGDLKKIFNGADTLTNTITEDMTELVKLGINRGWYLNEFFLFASYRHAQEIDDLDCFLEDVTLNEWDVYWSIIFSASPVRKSLLTEAKLAFEKKLYGAAIHMFFSQADGIFHDKFGTDLFKNRGHEARDKFSTHLTDLIARDSLELLIEQFKDASIFRRIFNEVYRHGFSVTNTDLMKKTDSILNEKEAVIPNRHGVLHGIHRNYGTKLNALKCLSLLLFVVCAINGDKTHESI